MINVAVAHGDGDGDAQLTPTHADGDAVGLSVGAADGDTLGLSLMLLALPLLLEDGARVAFDEVLPLLSLELLGDPVAFDPEPVALGGAVADEHDQSGPAPAALDRKAVPACA